MFIYSTASVFRSVKNIGNENGKQELSEGLLAIVAFDSFTVGRHLINQL